MESWFASGRIIDVIIALMALEAVALVLLRRRTAGGPAPVEIIVSLLAGFCLLIALRVALTDGRWEIVAAALAASLAAHLTDLRLRWMRTTPAAGSGAAPHGGAG